MGESFGYSIAYKYFQTATYSYAVKLTRRLYTVGAPGVHETNGLWVLFHNNLTNATFDIVHFLLHF